MQTFLPYADFSRCAGCLHWQHLGKQRSEVLTILRTLHGESKSGAWRNHPAVLMWQDYVEALVDYGCLICDEWVSRGYRDETKPKIQKYTWGDDTVMPPWLGDIRLHSSHRAALLYKNPAWYSQFGWAEKPDYPEEGRLHYYWPVTISGGDYGVKLPKSVRG